MAQPSRKLKITEILLVFIFSYLIISTSFGKIIETQLVPRDVEIYHIKRFTRTEETIIIDTTNGTLNIPTEDAYIYIKNEGEPIVEIIHLQYKNKWLRFLVINPNTPKTYALHIPDSFLHPPVKIRAEDTFLQ